MQLVHKNIIFLLKSFSLGGAEKQALFLAAYLQNQRNCRVYIYSYLPSENRMAFDQECEKYQLKNLYQVPNPLSTGGRFKNLKKRIKLYQLGKQLRKHKPDIIIPYLNPPSIMASMIYQTAGAKITFWHHRGVDFYRNDALEKKAAQKAPLFIANSENGVVELKEKLSIPNKRVYFLPNFSTIAKISHQDSSEIRKKLDIRKDAIVVGMVGHFRPEKFQQLLLESCLSLFEKFPIHLVFVGNKGEKSEFSNLEALLSNSDVKRRVSIVHNANAQDLLPVFDIGVLLSQNEGMPNVVMEYMSYHLPIITNPHSGCRTLLGKDYKFFVKNEMLDVQNKLSILVQDASLRKSLGERNHQRINHQFSIEYYVKALEKILSD